MSVFHEIFGDPLKQAEKAKQKQRENSENRPPKARQGISHNVAYIAVVIPMYVGLSVLALFLGTGPIAFVLFSISYCISVGG